MLLKPKALHIGGKVVEWGYEYIYNKSVLESSSSLKR